MRDAARHALSVAYLVTTYPVLSETFVRLEVEQLRRQGAQVTVVSLFEGDPPDADAVYLYGQGRPRWRLAAAHVRWALRSPRRYARFWRVVRASGEERGEVFVRHLPWLAGELRRRGVELLHAHFAWSSAARAWALSELMGLPWSMTVHAHDMFGKPYRLQEKLAAADGVVTVCRYNVEQLRSGIGYDGPVDLVVCGVEVPEELPPAAPEVDVLAVGRLVDKKGFDLLVQAAALLRDRGLSVEIVGDGPQRASLQDQIDAAGVAKHVTLTGARPHDDVLARMSQARVVCLPARVAPNGDRDSMPLVVKEAMAREVPVVATAVAGIPEMLDDSCGWLVPPDDPRALAAALAEALDQPAEAARRASSGRRRVAEEFRLDGEVARLEQVFRRIVA